MHSYFIGSSAIVNSNRLISVGYTDEPLRAWDLTETKLPTELLGDYAKYLSGRRLTATGTLVTLQPEELAELSRSLRQRAPQLFE